MLERYQLRYAAGQYWLLDMEQAGVPYKRPMFLNEVGAEIWKMLKKGYTIEQIAEAFSREYEVTKEEVHEDVVRFQEQLIAYGIEIGEF